MALQKIFFFLFLVVIFSACERSYQRVLINEEFKKGVPLEKLLDLKSNEQLVAVVETNLGKFEIELFAKETPKTVKNFVGLALEGYYNGIIFHRVIKDFMIQTGDSTGTGSGGRSFYGKEFEDEIVNELKHNAAGIVSMANRGPATNTSQFFITTVATPHLDGRHTVFGKVVNGMEVVYQIGNAKTGSMDKPVEKIAMQKVTIEKRIY